ncbi:MAG: amidohydrolase family protein [Caldilineaceae bacterium]
MNLSHLPIFDHHAHPLHRRETTETVATFRRWFGETSSDEVREKHFPNSLVFRMAVKWLAEYLHCEPTLEAILEERSKVAEQEWTRRLFQDANINTLLLDYGFGTSSAYNQEQMQALLPDIPIQPMMRIEVEAERLIAEQHKFGAFEEAFINLVETAQRHGHVALKSIIAYRTGLMIGKPDRDNAKEDFHELRRVVEKGGKLRLASLELCQYLATLAIEAAGKQGIPIQFHTGFGDSDADLRAANPLHMRYVVEKYPQVQFVLLHAGWPFYRELAHFAAIYPNVWMDLSLAVPFATTGIPTMIRDVLGMAPISKVMFATDAFTMPEIFWIAAKWGRWGLGKVLDEFISEGFMDEDEALEAAQQILSRNSQQLYLGSNG